PCGRVRLAIITVDHEADDVVDDSQLAECVHRRRVAAVISRQVYSYLEVSQARVLDGPHRLPDVRRVYEYVSRAIVRARRFNQFVVGWHPHYEVAGTGIQGIANKATPLRPPCISDLCVHLFSDDLRERVFKAFSRL